VRSPSWETHFDPASLAQRIAELEAQSSAPGIWDDPRKAGVLMKLLTVEKAKLQKFRELESEVKELDELTPMIDPIAEPALADECLQRIAKAEEALKAIELETFLSGKHDRSNALLSVHSGTGGTDAMDWAEMLLRMYLRYAERHDATVSLIEESRGEEAGIKSATVRISMPYAYGYLKGEKGTHRLVRLSPFNAKALRQTSFALVEVLPEIEDDVEFEINPAELRIDVYRAGGAGGQNVNKTSSAVRVTHLPTGIQVASQAERSQPQNKEIAMNILKSKLLAIREEEALKEVNALKGTFQKAEFGAQIRSYVMQPYTMVKDLRTGVETGKVDAYFSLKKTPERERTLLFTHQPLVTQTFVFFAGVDSKITWTGRMEELRTRRIGVVSRTSYGPIFDRAAQDLLLSLDEANTFEQNLAKLVAGRVDLVINSLDVGRELVQRLGAGDQVVALAQKYNEAMTRER